MGHGAKETDAHRHTHKHTHTYIHTHTYTYIPVDFTPISLPDYERWVLEQKKSRFSVTIVARSFKAASFGKGIHTRVNVCMCICCIDVRTYLCIIYTHTCIRQKKSRSSVTILGRSFKAASFGKGIHPRVNVCMYICCIHIVVWKRYIHTCELYACVCVCVCMHAAFMYECTSVFYTHTNLYSKKNRVSLSQL